MQVISRLRVHTVTTNMWLRGVVAATPDPPRPVNRYDVLAHQSWLVGVACSAFTALAFGFAAFAFDQGAIRQLLHGHPAGTLVAAWGLVGGGLFAITPINYYRRLRVGTSAGIVLPATVEQVRLRRGQPDDPWNEKSILASLGVAHPIGMFSKSVPLPYPWGPSVREGDTLAVLAHPTRRQYLVMLGPPAVDGTYIPLPS